jgi:hypothetical protein
MMSSGLPVLRCLGGVAIRQEPRAARCGDIGPARRRRGRPPQVNPEGPGAFAPRVRRRACPYPPVRAAPFSCPGRKLAPAQAGTPDNIML